MTDSLEEWLAASLSGDVVSRYDLPTEAELNAVHAQLARGAREQRRFILFQLTDGDNEPSISNDSGE
jgi:hypothetical protein